MIITPLLDHQKALLQRAINRQPYTALWAPLGCGKTLVALSLAERIKAGNVLVTCDKTDTLITWPEQIHIHTDRNYICLQDKRIARFDKENITGLYPYYYIVGYDYLKWHWDTIRSIPFDLWIGDESEAYRNTRTWRVKALRQIVRKIPNRVIISGKPESENVEDYFGQMLCLDDGKALGTSITQYRRRYMLPDPDGYGWVAKVTALKEISKKIASYVASLPPGHSFVLPAVDSSVSTAERSELCGGVQSLMRQLKEEFRMVIDGKKIDLDYASAVFSKMYQLSGGTVISTIGDSVHVWDRQGNNPKLKMMHEYIDAGGMNPYKYIIWCNFRAEAEMLSNAFTWVTWKLTGESTTKQRQTVLKAFKEAGPNTVLILTYGFAKGLNDIVSADRIIIYSRPYSYRTFAQAMARTNRIGAVGWKGYHHLVVRDTPDEHIYKLLQEKRDFTQTAEHFREMCNA